MEPVRIIRAVESSVWMDIERRLAKSTFLFMDLFLLIFCGAESGVPCA
jgi:hypothetical protein